MLARWCTIVCALGVGTACGGDDRPVAVDGGGISADAGGGAGDAGVDAGPRADGGVATDGGGTGDDAGATDDAGTASDAGSLDAGSSDAGMSDAGCPPPVCPPPPVGCSYVGATACACGTLVCAGCGTGGTPCTSVQYCRFTSGCGPSGADFGMCVTRPLICPDIYMPVCGCDGADYGNDCEAHAAGTNVASSGMCAPPSDCRTRGCPSGQSCEPCRGIGGILYVCLPTGTVC